MRNMKNVFAGIVFLAITYQFTSTGMGLENYNQLNIIPNPEKGAITVTLSGVEGQSTSKDAYTIMNESGQTIQVFELNSSNKYFIHIENLSNGIYFIVGFNNNQMIRQKVVVAK